MGREGCSPSPAGEKFNACVCVLMLRKITSMLLSSPLSVNLALRRENPDTNPVSSLDFLKLSFSVVPVVFRGWDIQEKYGWLTITMFLWGSIMR